MNPKCTACGAGSWKVGFSQSKRRVYKCKDKSCGKKFNKRAGMPFHGLHFPDGAALMGTLLYAKYPLSSYDVSEILLFNGVEVSHTTICGWQPCFARYVRTIAKKYFLAPSPTTTRLPGRTPPRHNSKIDSLLLEEVEVLAGIISSMDSLLEYPFDVQKLGKTNR